MITRRTLLRNLSALGASTSLKPFSFGQGLEATPPNAEVLIQQFMRKYSVPGFSVTFMKGRNLLYSGNFGVANKQSRTPVTLQSLFRIASNSKAYTSAAIFTLIEAGKLRLDDLVFAPNGILSKYSNIGPHSDWIHTITVHHLLTHTAGGWSNDNNDPMFEKLGFNHDQLIAWTLQSHPLENPPGQKYAYSNFGYCVLGRVIEQISQMPYAQYVHQRILNKCECQDMRISANKSAPNEVTYYSQESEDPYSMPISRMDSHGGWIATSVDMARFMAGLFSPRDNGGSLPILEPSSLNQMLKGTQANPGYTCGLATNKAGNFWHMGSLPGTQSIMVHTHTRLSWAAVINTRASNGDQAGADLDDMLWKIAKAVPQWGA